MFPAPPWVRFATQKYSVKYEQAYTQECLQLLADALARMEGGIHAVAAIIAAAALTAKSGQRHTLGAARERFSARPPVIAAKG